MTKFRTDFGRSARPEDPESLFRDLKNRSADIKHLWSHQADILRAYSKDHLATTDIALELPTGAGKTLVGLLIAEFRRRKFDERVLYLCPTRQLANQVGAQAQWYGIPAHVLVGNQIDYTPAYYTEYKTNAATAITTYSGLFNTNPRLDDAQTIILDDAHSGENHIASLWSLEITRKEPNDTLFSAMISLLKDGLPDALLQRLESEWSPEVVRHVDMVPGPYFREKEATLRALLDEQIPNGNRLNYAWKMIRDHIHACNMYVTWGTILLRPIIPPTQTHQPFNAAKQRIYMSATLGAGGELERVTGVRQIRRLPIPAGWDKQGSGRRLFLIPELSLSGKKADSITVAAARAVERTLILVPNMAMLKAAKSDFEDAGIDVLSATDIEDSLAAFTTKANVALILANRYDGIDLQGDACRLLVVFGLPGGTNLQESFLLSRLAATSLLRDRMLTRFTQAVGRCTRSDNDFAAVLLREESLTDLILKSENRQLLHPEIQAELEFAISNSKDQRESDFLDLLALFLKQGSEWQEANVAIIGLRAGKTKREDGAAGRLQKVAPLEVDFLYAIWKGNFEQAVEKAKAVAEALDGNETKGYRGWWYYLMGDAALRLFAATKIKKWMDIAKDAFRRASTCAVAVSWLAELSRIEAAKSEMAPVDLLSPRAVENIREQLKSLGGTGKKFEERMTALLNDIGKDDFAIFHRGLAELGRILGFDTETPGSEAAPDSVWSLQDMLHIAHEAKTEQTPADLISVSDVRQAEGHAKWISANRPCAERVPVVCTIITPRKLLAKDALPHAQSLYHVSPSQYRLLAKDAVQVLRSVRAACGELGDEAVLETITENYRVAKLLPNDVVARFTAQLVSKLPTK